MLGLPLIGFLVRLKRPAMVALGYLAFLLVVAAFLFVLWKVPEWQVQRAIAAHQIPPEKIPELQNEYRRTLTQVLGGIVVLYGLWLTWKRVRATERTVELSLESQITDRFTKAIEQLGSNKQAVRLGAIYALERIAKDSPKDHWTIMEVLTAYVRENSPWTGEEQNKAEGASKPAQEDSPAKADGHRPTTEIQAILTVIGRRDCKNEDAERHRLDLSGTDLRGANLQGLQFSNAILVETHLEYATLFETNPNGANFSGAILLTARLSSATLIRANLNRALLLAAKLNGATLAYSKLSDAKLPRADLSGAHFSRANLDGADLSEANLTGAKFSEACLDWADLKGALNMDDDQKVYARKAGAKNVPD